LDAPQLAAGCAAGTWIEDRTGCFMENMPELNK